MEKLSLVFRPALKAALHEFPASKRHDRASQEVISATALAQFGLQRHTPGLDPSIRSLESKHALGIFLRQRHADWTGLLVTVLATKFFFEVGSADSRKPPHHWLRPAIEFVQDHSLTIFLVITGLGWIRLFAVSDPTSKWGQVVGNIVSEWTQILGMVVLTKRLLELHSKESRK